jgi:exopolyphosphatase/guanosine-5'-triphosphate,3'-diphosphate pyrophosphatase
MFIDVGGGSTEIYIYKSNKHFIQSFQLGGVRMMLKKDEITEWKRMEKWLKNHKDIEAIIGLGGNVRSFLNIHNSKKMKTDSFHKKFKKLNELNIKERIEKYGLATDRADVIGFAMRIYEKIVKQLDIKTIQSTKWGVSDSIAVKTFHEIYSAKISIYEDK